MLSHYAQFTDIKGNETFIGLCRTLEKAQGFCTDHYEEITGAPQLLMWQPMGDCVRAETEKGDYTIMLLELDRRVN